MADQRSRTITWADPIENAERLAGLSGLDALRAIMSGEAPPPPIAVLMGFDLVEADARRAVFLGRPEEFHYNPIGVVHGGLAATLLDSAMGCAVQTTCPAGVAYTTLEIKTNFVRPITLGAGVLRCEGTVLYRGRRSATAEGKLVEQATGRLLAHGTTTCLVTDRPT
jgi:uncharacterized protein (TIGR00369 family)